MNQGVTDGASLRTSWAERNRRSELANLHILVRRIRKTVMMPALVALAIGIAALGPLLGWPRDSTLFRATLLLGLVLAAVLWIKMLLAINSGRHLVHKTSTRSTRSRAAKGDGGR